MRTLSMCSSQENLKNGKSLYSFSIAPKIKGGVIGTAKKFGGLFWFAVIIFCDNKSSHFEVLVFHVVVLHRLAQVNLDPLAFLVLLNLKLQHFQPLQILKSLNETLVWVFASVAQNSHDNRRTDFTKSPPWHGHHHQHDQVEQRQLQNNEKHIQQQH